MHPEIFLEAQDFGKLPYSGLTFNQFSTSSLNHLKNHMFTKVNNQ